MYITGILGRPDTYFAHAEMSTALPVIEAFAKNHRGSYITCVRVDCETAYIVGVRKQISREMIYNTEAEMLDQRDKLARFFSPREVYILELKPVQALKLNEEAFLGGSPLMDNAEHYNAKHIDMRQCSCHPDDNPPVPCPRKFALIECRAAAGDEEAQAQIDGQLALAHNEARPLDPMEDFS